MIIYAVYRQYHDYEADEPMLESLWTTREAAEQELASEKYKHKWYDCSIYVAELHVDTPYIYGPIDG